MVTDYIALKQLIQPQLTANQTDDQILTWVNTPSITRTVSKFISTRTMMADLGPTQADALLTKLEGIATQNSMVARVIKMLDPNQGGIDIGLAATRAAIDGLVTAGALSNSDSTALKSMGEETVSPAVNAGFYGVTLGDIQFARAQ